MLNKVAEESDVSKQTRRRYLYRYLVYQDISVLAPVEQENWVWYYKKKRELFVMLNGIAEETVNEILKFRDERDWKQFHTPKDLALSLCLEAAELLEVFQWSGTDLYCTEKKEKIKEELADIINYSVLMADACDIDLDSASREKLQRNEEKYPVEKAYGISKKYTEL